MLRERPRAIDLFCGVGGMSLGFRRAGFEVVKAVDIDPIHVETYNRNFGHGSAVEGDVFELSGSDVLAGIGNAGDGVDVLFGGAPCQGFSVGGKRRVNDPRNDLLDEFARLVVEIQPKLFVAENVAGLMNERMASHLDRFLGVVRSGGFEIVEPIQILNAAHYGVPQRRKRVFILGYQPGNPAPTYPRPSANPVSVGQAIKDLPYGMSKDEFLNSDTFSGPLGKPSAYVVDLENTFASLKPSGGNRPVSGFRRTRHGLKTVRRFEKVPVGTADPVSRFYRLEQGGLAPTLRAGTDATRGGHTAPRPIHFHDPRCITVREAARLHSYPDWFSFHATKWHGFRQIGNSVPPLLALAVGRSVISALKEEKVGS